MEGQFKVCISKLQGRFSSVVRSAWLAKRWSESNAESDLLRAQQHEANDLSLCKQLQLPPSWYKSGLVCNAPFMLPLPYRLVLANLQ